MTALWTFLLYRVFVGDPLISQGFLYKFRYIFFLGITRFVQLPFRCIYVKWFFFVFFVKTTYFRFDLPHKISEESFAIAMNHACSEEQEKENIGQFWLPIFSDNAIIL